ncbi:uncharacterized protein ycf20 isoform X2 [Nymphaea colorata]|uniref:uncharacterized protein ycf20 isoform X2 n=1 Tax=Nymphaea colorata TaxID=210225 RepID=UPI00214E5554|nr:uncharacterized protein ycf20 isoform X2 [Nymphaea colorata]
MCVVIAKEHQPSLVFQKNLILPASLCIRRRCHASNHLQWTAWITRHKVLPRLRVVQTVLSYSVTSTSLSGREQDPPIGADSGTRLIKAVQSFGTKLNEKVERLKKGLPIKILSFLVGFYCATAFATVIGQTGDWDILSAGLAVVIVEAIGALMYRASFPLFDRIRSLITFFNYWKAGLSLGLFLDSFKYEIDTIFGLFDSSNLEIDLFPLFW